MWSLKEYDNIGFQFWFWLEKNTTKNVSDFQLIWRLFMEVDVGAKIFHDGNCLKINYIVISVMKLRTNKWHTRELRANIFKLKKMSLHYKEYL